MKRLLGYIRCYLPLYAVAVAAMVISILLDALSPQITRKIIDEVIVGGRMELLMRLLLGLLGIGLGRAVFQYTKEFIFDFAASGIGCRLRKDLFDHIQKLSVGYFDSHNTGELMARVKDDVDRIWDACGYIGMLILECTIHTCLIVFCMFQISPVLTLIPLMIMPLIVVFALKMENGLGGVYDKISEETAEMNTVAQENLAGVRTVKAFAREVYEIGKFKSHNQKFYHLNMEQAKLVAKYQPCISFLSKLLTMLVIVAGGTAVIRGKITIGALGAFVEYTNNITWPMEMVGWLSNGFAAALASNRKIQAIFAQEPEVKNPELGKREDVGLEGLPVIQECGTSAEAAGWSGIPKEVPSGKNEKPEKQPINQVEKTEETLVNSVGQRADLSGGIRFKHVDFVLHGQTILKDIDFELLPGKTLGIMGMTGSGKTSIVNLLQRFYDVTSGEIQVDKVDIRQLPLAYLRGKMAVVMQDVFLFSDSISENISLGNKEQMRWESIEHAAVCADAHSFIMRLGQQYNTVIGERGVGLSGGQKQRISIARAIAKERPVLILDDSTSALDTETEKEIEGQLDRLENCTKIIIGHRISAVRNADEILVLDHGRIAERGTHRELMEKQGQYYRTYMVQYGTMEVDEYGSECKQDG